MDIHSLIDRMEQFREREGVLPPGFRVNLGAAFAWLSPPLREELDKLAAQLADDNADQVLAQIHAELDRVVVVNAVPE